MKYLKTAIKELGAFKFETRFNQAAASIENFAGWEVFILKYRSDIDGLRALAVCLVVLFHLGFSQISGGFVGVDVFFTISGYLISRNIMEADNFSFTTFYTRRARRLFPAALVVVVLTLIASRFLLSPGDYVRAAYSGLAAIPSASNFVFWAESGYWDTVAKTKPLLHTWTLAVEEQFYLIWPILIVLVTRFWGKTALLVTFVVLMVGGMALAEWATQSFPSAAFYLMPFRITEFAIGALYAAAEPRLTSKRPMILSQAMIAAGLGLILYAAVGYTEETRFPGLSVVVPCVGTILLIAAGPAPFLGRLLDNPVAVFVGKISYSIYLTHWPLIALYSYTHLGELTLFVQGALLAATITTAIALYFFVESPLRRPGNKALSPLGFGLAAATTAYGITLATVFTLPQDNAVASVAAVSPGPVLSEPGDQPIVIADHRTGNQARVTELRAAGCTTGCLELISGLTNILIIGDSHGLDGWNSTSSVMPEAHVIYGAYPACKVYTNLADHYRDRDERGAANLPAERQAICLGLVENAYFDANLLDNIDIIIFSHRLSLIDTSMLEITLPYLVANTSARIIVLGNGPVFTESLPDIIRAEGLSLQNNLVPVTYLDGDFRRWSLAAREVVEHNGIEFIDVFDLVCPDSQCNAFTGAFPYSYDTSHMSIQTSHWFGETFLRDILSD